MSVKASAWVWENHPEVAGNDLLVLLALADGASQEGEEACYSARTLAKMARCDRSTVFRILSRLKDAGVIEATGKSGRYKTVVYRIVGMADPSHPCDPSQSATRRTEATSPVALVRPNPSTNPTTRTDSSSRGADTEAPQRVPRPVNAALTAATPQPMPPGWYPSSDTTDYLRFRAVGSSVTVENSYDRFVAFHREAGQRKRNWDEAFIAWVSDDLVRARRDSKVEESTHDDLGQRRGVDPEVRARTLEAMRLRTEQQARLVTKDEEQ